MIFEIVEKIKKCNNQSTLLEIYNTIRNDSLTFEKINEMEEKYNIIVDLEFSLITEISQINEDDKSRLVEINKIIDESKRK